MAGAGPRKALRASPGRSAIPLGRVIERCMTILLQISSIILGAALTAQLAIVTYFREREHELILDRYLEGSLDYLAADLSQVSESFQHNWARCLAILKSYRDGPDEFDLNELTTGFVEVPGSRLNIVAHHRLQTLTGSSDYWCIHQKAMAFFTTANSVIVK